MAWIHRKEILQDSCQGKRTIPCNFSKYRTLQILDACVIVQSFLGQNFKAMKKGVICVNTEQLYRLHSFLLS